MKIHPLVVSLLCAAVAPATGAFAATLPLSDLDLKLVLQVSQAARPKLSANNHQISIAGERFKDGFGTRGSSRLEISLDGQAETFSASVGVTDDTSKLEPGPVWFEVIGDGKLLYSTEPMSLGERAQAISVPLSGVKDLVLAVQGGDQPRPCSAWADSTITYNGAKPVAIERAEEKPYILTPKPGPEPKITGAPIVGARPGHPFLFRVSATGERPMNFSAENLPPGLSIDSATGQITGSVAAVGEYRVPVTAKNASGSASRELRIVIGDTLALTPPMGWNSWNCFASAVTANDVRAAADSFVKDGLIDHGWTYINVDDYWMTRPVEGDPIVKETEAAAEAQGKSFHLRPNGDPSLVGAPRDSEGRINANSRFPDMAGLANYIHSLGLKAGLYSSPGPLTCGQCISSYAHELQDASRFAEWGFDYLKYDWCSYGFYAKDESTAENIKPYDVMGNALHQQPRDIVFSLCQYGRADVWKWGANVDGNCWRTTGDITDSWGSMSGIGFSQNGHDAYAGPGHWNDPDMLVVGWVGWGPRLHQSRLTPDEQYTHISLWSLLAAPLLIGCDLTKVDDFTLNLLTNDEVIAVDQDMIGRPAHRVSRHRDFEVWARPLADGSIAVGLFNRGEIPADISTTWAELGLTGPKTVRDLWRQKDLGTSQDRFSATVPRHGVVLVKIGPPAP